MTLINRYIEVTLVWPSHAPSVPVPADIYQSFPRSHVYRTLPTVAHIFDITSRYESQPETVVIEHFAIYETAPQIFGTQSFKQAFRHIPSEQSILRFLQQGQPNPGTSDSSIPAPHPLQSLQDEIPEVGPTPMPEDFTPPVASPLFGDNNDEILSTDRRDRQPEA